MAWAIIIAGGILFLVSLLWYIWAGKLLRGQRAVSLGKNPAPVPVEADKEALQDQMARWDDQLREQPLSSLTILRKRVADALSTATEYLINRDLRIAYSRSAYVNRAFYVNVRIGPQGGVLPELTPEDLKTLKQTESERLQFEALEEEPEVQVELKFAAGDFSANKTQEKQRLKKDKEARFRFLLKPLKAEHCILTVVVSYVSKLPVPDQVVEKVTIDKVITPGAGPETKEHVEQATVTPATTATAVTEVKTVELPVSVKSLFGWNARELELLQKALGPVVVMILLGIALFTGRVESTDAIWYIIMGIANAAGIPVIDAVAKPFEKPDPDAPDGEEESYAAQLPVATLAT